jgi:GrpB-like predicted nucleotidyltransferase (UPF0157 family)
VVRKIEVLPYDAEWAVQFESEARSLAPALGEQTVAIHHVGSTAVPGLCAKPTIDILVEVQKIEAIDDVNDDMRELGYEARGEWGIPGRRYFIKSAGERRTHHVHMYQTGHPEIDRMPSFRDYLRAHREEAEAYGRLKRRLAREFPDDPRSYTEGKTEFIGRIDALARGGSI